MESNVELRPKFGNRSLEDESQIFKHNAWDNVEWNENQESQAKQKVKENSEVIFTSSELDELYRQAPSNWDSFYSIHQNRFFKDRNWIFTEFEELNPKSKISLNSSQNGDQTDLLPSQMVSSENSEENESFLGSDSGFKVLEVGCGVGNTVFPILEKNLDPDLFVYCCDFSSKAINLVKESDQYDKKRCHAFVCDIADSGDWKPPFPEGSLDAIICIFVLSALHPDKCKKAIVRLASYLKPGGVILMRDYGRYDMAQLRFKRGRCLSEHFYARGDGTFCYFFTQEEIRNMMLSAGLEEQQNLVDRRLQVNRGKQLTMYRVWVQAKYRKPL